MTHEADYKKFQNLLNTQYPGSLVNDEEAAEAYRNLGEFACLLVRINEREKIVSLEDLQESDSTSK